MHERIYDEIFEKAKATALRRVVGDTFKKGLDQGPQVNIYLSITLMLFLVHKKLGIFLILIIHFSNHEIFLFCFLKRVNKYII